MVLQRKSIANRLSPEVILVLAVYGNPIGRVPDGLEVARVWPRADAAAPATARASLGPGARSRRSLPGRQGPVRRKRPTQMSWEEGGGVGCGWGWGLGGGLDARTPKFELLGRHRRLASGRMSGGESPLPRRPDNRCHSISRVSAVRWRWPSRLQPLHGLLPYQ